MVFQDYALWPHMTVEQNVAFALHRHRLAPETARRQTRVMLERVGLDMLGHRYPNELSGGEQQRVALARALVANTGLILFDEPLSNLDAHLRDRLRVEIATLVRECGATAIYITHDQAEAFALADDIGILSHGRLIQMGSPEEIYLNPATAFVARFTGLAGELAVHVHGPSASGNVQVRLGDRLVEARAPRPLQRGIPAQLLVRPSAGGLVASGDDRADLLGVVRDVAFRGRVTSTWWTLPMAAGCTAFSPNPSGGVDSRSESSWTLSSACSSNTKLASIWAMAAMVLRWR